jgi:hypothetical protein
VLRCDWELLAFVILSNHLHLLLKTPQPNLAKGMQAFLSAYAVWSAKRRRRPAHWFQGRYKVEMIEDESDYWTVSRYIHLNPVRARLVARPEEWEWSSDPGYVAPSRRHPWVRYETRLAAWRSDWGSDSVLEDPKSSRHRLNTDLTQIKCKTAERVRLRINLCLICVQSVANTLSFFSVFFVPCWFVTLPAAVAAAP